MRRSPRIGIALKNIATLKNTGKSPRRYRSSSTNFLLSGPASKRSRSVLRDSALDAKGETDTELVVQITREYSGIDMENLPMRANPSLPQPEASELLTAVRPDLATTGSAAPVAEEEIEDSQQPDPPVEQR